jgi:hypothetical protein
MKLKVLTLALAVAAISTVSFAQQTETKQCCKQQPPKEQCDKAPERPCPVMAALEDLQLTDAQRSAIENLGKTRAEAAQQKCESDRKQRFEADSLARVAQRQEQLDFLHSLKSILTADQYVSFLENTIVNNPQQPQGRPEGPQQGPRPRDGKKCGKCCKEGAPACPAEGAQNAEGKCCKDSKK